MGEFILILAVAAAGFTVGRFSSRKAAGTSGAPGAGLPHPAQIFEEGYQAGMKDAALAARREPAGAGSGYTQAQRAAGRQPDPAQAWAPVPVPPAPAPPAPVTPVSQPAGTHTSAAATQPVRVPPATQNVLPPRNPPPPRVRTEAELAAEKQRRDLRNINITLYSGSLLLVAAAALFIGISIPEEARFAGIVALTALFYSSGLVIHSRRKNLRPAAVAFTGTGLALIPVVGLALHNFLLHDAALAWLVTSLVGTAAFAYAAARLDSRVVTYLALTFLLSTALASGAAVRSGIVWYFAFTVLLATLVSLAAIRRPGWLKNIYLDAFVHSHRYLVPATAAAAVLTSQELGTGPLSVLFLAIAGYYAVLMWQGPAGQRLVHSYGVRAGATAGLVALTHYLFDSVPLTQLAAVVLLGVQAAALIGLRQRYSAAAALHRSAGRGASENARVPADVPRSGAPAPVEKPAARMTGRYYRIDVAAVLGLQFLAGLGATIGYGVEVRSGDGNLFAYAVSAVLVLLTLCAAAWKFKDAVEAVPSVALVLGALPRLLSGQAPLWPLLLLVGLLCGYLVLRAVRAQGNNRRAFVLAVRSTGVALVPLAIFTVLEMQQPGAAWTWTLAGAFAAVAGNQTASVLLRGTGRPEQFPNAALGFSISIGIVLAFALRFEEAPSIVLTLSALWTLVVVNVLSSLVLRPRSENAGAAPAGFIAAAGLGAGLLGLAGYELLTAAALAYCALQVLKFSRGTVRGYYLAAAHILLTLLTALLAADLDFSVHGIFIAMALSLAVQHILRTVLHRRLAGVGLGAVLTWGTLLAQAVLALAYYVLLPTGAQPETGAVLLLTAAGSAVFTQTVSAFALKATAGKGKDAGQGSGAGLVPKAVQGSDAGRDTIAAAVLALALAGGLRAADAPGDALALAGLWAAFGANVLTAFLHRNTRLALAAPAGFLAAALIGAGLLGLRGYQLLVAAALVYALVVVRDRANAYRGAYLAGAQVLAGFFAALVTADLTEGTGGFFIALAVAFAAAQVLRTVFHHRVEPLGLAEPARWGGLLVLGLLPLAYVPAPGRVDADVLLTLILLAAAVAVFTQLTAAAGISRGIPLPNAAVLALTASAAVLAAQTAAGFLGHPQAGWTLALVWVALGANIATTELLRPGRWEGIGVAGFAAAALTGAGLLEVRGYELLVLLAMAYAGYLASRRNQPNRGQYLLGVQALAATLAVLVAADAGAGVHGQFTAGSLVLAAAQILRAILAPRLAGIGLAAAAQWATMAVLALAPAWYAGTAWTAGVQRDVVALQLLLLLSVAVAGFARWRTAAFLYPAVYAVGALPLILTGLMPFGNAGVLPGTPIGILPAGIVLLVLAAAALTGETRTEVAPPVRTALLTAAAAYPAAVLAVAAAEESLILTGLATAVLAAVFLTASYSRSRPWLAAGMPPLVVTAALVTVAEFERSLLWTPMAPGYGYLWTAWSAALLLQAVRMFISLAEGVPGTALRTRIMGSASGFVLALGAVPAMAEWNHAALTGSLTLLAALGLSAREFPPALRETAMQAAVLPAALAVQRIGWHAIGERIDVFWSVQYWAAILAGLAAWEFLRKRESRGTVLLGVSAVILSGSGLTTIGSGAAGQQLWALVAHAALLAFGLLASRRLFTIWGAAGVALAVLWYLRGYTFLLLALLAAGLIALAVWRLARVRTEPEEAREKEESRT